MIHVLIYNYKFSIQKKIRLCQDKYWWSCTKSECAAPGDIHCQHLFKGSLKKFQKYQEEGALQELTSMWGMNLSWRKQCLRNHYLQNMLLLINYILPVVMPTLMKFCNLDCLASLHLYIWQADTGHVCKFVCFNVTLQCSKRWSTENSIIWLINIYTKHSLSYLGPVLWSKLEKSIRLSDSLGFFKKRIKQVNFNSLLDFECKDCFLCNN